MQLRRSFEEDGHFYAGHVKFRDAAGAIQRRRVLCFVLNRGNVLGASAHFHRKDAYNTARRAAAGTLPLPEPQPTAGAMLCSILKIRGFPIPNVQDASVEIDDDTAAVVRKELLCAA